MTSRMMLSAAVTIIIGCLPGRARAYETPTHSRITSEAIDISVLVTDPGLLDDLGLGGDIDQYALPGEVPVNENDPQPDKTFYLAHVPVRRIIKAGAVLEDRSTNSLHHFYDSFNEGRGLVLGHKVFIRVGIASPDWMLETDSSMLSRAFIQHFSYGDSIRYFYKGLTSNQAIQRDINLGLMFRGLGHLVHHIQDMAQPQHVRNDQHCDKSASPSCRFLDNPSHFEKYTDRHRNTIVPGPGGYPVPEFPLMKQFWDNVSETGMAEFTQSNFVSQGTNFEIDHHGNLGSNPDYPLPIPYLETATFPMDLAAALQQSGIDSAETQSVMRDLRCEAPLACMIDFIPSQVFDRGLQGSAAIQLNSRASSISLLDDELKNTERPHSAITTYNRLNFHAAYPFLIPRAIAYSAGMINHFFRGRMAIEETEPDQDGNALITVTNSSEPGNAFNSGSFELYYESMEQGRKPVPLYGINSGRLPLQPGDALQLGMVVPADVDEQRERPYLLVFNALEGQLGAEPGLAAVAFDIPISGTVERLSRGANLCPERVYGISIVFARQPDNAGRVVLQGEQSGAEFDFSAIPAGVNVIRNEAMWRHMADEYSGGYRYEVTYRHQDSSADPCTAPFLGPWLQNERVKVLSPSD